MIETLYLNTRKNYEKSNREKLNFLNLLNIIISMFEYENLPDSLPQEFIERYLCVNGLCGFAKSEKDEIVCFPCSLSGNVDEYGRGKIITGAVNNYSFNVEKFVDGVCGFNNSLYTPDYELFYFADMLAETDISMKTNLIYSRLLPLPVAHDEKTKIAIETAFKKICNGEMGIIVSDNLLKFDVNGELVNSEIPTVNLTDVNKIDRIQYVSQFHADLLKRFYNIYGQSLQTQGKLAQQTVDEIHGMDSVSFIIPLDKLNQRRKMVDELNELFGLNISVDFSESWKREFKNFEKGGEIDENGNIEELETNDVE